jgi:L-lactate dehydrogenase complex protein LldG
MDQEAVTQLLAAKAATVQAVVSEIASFTEAVAYTVKLMQKHGYLSLAAPGIDAGQRVLLEDSCDTAALTLLESPLIDHTTGIHTTLTLADWGIAETGTLVLKSTSEDIRLATMLAEVHIALLAESRILPDAETLAPHLNEVLKTDSPSYTAFITGASRTADIERVLAIGVHGPQELHILIHKGA